MAQITLPQGIASISGKIGNIVFYFRNGKQYARRLDKRLISTEALSKRCREIIEPLSGVIAPPEIDLRSDLLHPFRGPGGVAE